ncbi:MAG: type II toxin-antitoxin system VapC family toxin [Candidatus Sericytochromatia bacterium]|nr:type II toxin-antitoxin system VapC family toxin [Candidatus Tanganyikabacteria bacterium]
MNLLLDSCTLIWLRTSRDRIPDAVLAAVADGANRVLVSAATAWELAIKRSLGRLAPSFEPEEVFPRMLAESGLDALPVTLEHALKVSRLPLHHRDPFDRLLVTQCQVEGLTMVTPDPLFAPYAIPVLW